MNAHQIITQHAVDQHHSRVCVPLGGRCHCPEPDRLCLIRLDVPTSRDDGSMILCLRDIGHPDSVAHADSPIRADGRITWGTDEAQRAASMEAVPDHLCGAPFRKAFDTDVQVMRQCTLDQHDTGAHDDPSRRSLACIEAWPECSEGEYNPACCRFPKSCSADIHHSLLHTSSRSVEPPAWGVLSSSRESSSPVDAQTTEQPGAVRPDAPIAPTPETEAADHGLFVHEVPRYLPSRGRRRDEPEDPPEVDLSVDPGQPGSLPPIESAAERVGLFLRGFGDGKIMGREDGLPPLYARDLEVLVQAHDPSHPNYRRP